MATNTEPVVEQDRREQAVVVERPWGRFERFCLNEPTTVKVITIAPGQRLSLQRHEHRAELWQALDEGVQASVDGLTWTMRRGEVAWVPLGAPHRLTNPGGSSVRVLELGFGHFDEDDIERLQDDYARG
ncbi:phosphomannose isomerase type II C-terminal cupin domain [Ornithinimicrobium pratense]|uniref:Cupin domain-containing protein n=1 Tax=Ornithinimicrobium pratense TaxID=2593973 RepID=A0A5J6V8Q3_9MICO|nr:phosphomannose isomerase type II C-terminal cupin domain [Ornithinimicrobium pratense]QFG69546.1 cupin domain-containing protein [Ornithinimicrobium pratense]